MIEFDAADIDVRISEVQRYLGYGKNIPDEQVTDVIKRCINRLKKETMPRAAVKYFPITLKKDVVIIEGMHIKSKGLIKNLAGCDEAALFAATVGDVPDRLVKRNEIMGKMTEAAVYQASAAALEEAWCDIVDMKIKNEARKRGLYARPRFSPGYGDFSLEFQKDFSRILDMPKEVGIMLNDALLMYPSKSVTAVIGLSKVERPCVIEGCESCEMNETCAFSRV